MKNILDISRKLSTLSYLLHFKGVFISTNSLITNSDLERFMIIIHSYINQQTDCFIKDTKKVDLKELGESFKPESLDYILSINDDLEYLNLVDREVLEVIQDYKLFLNEVDFSDDEYIYGLALNQLNGFKTIYEKFKYDKENYEKGIIEEINHPPRITEPFDLEAVLDDLF